MSIDKSWMNLKNHLSSEYFNGVKAFIDKAKSYVNEQGVIRCPCQKCLNRMFQMLSTVEAHLIDYGFQQTYKKWTFHGEVSEDSDSDNMVHGDDYRRDDDEIFEFLNDVIGRSNNEWREFDTTIDIKGETPIETTNGSKFDAFFSEVKTELYPGCNTFLIKN